MTATRIRTLVRSAAGAGAAGLLFRGAAGSLMLNVANTVLAVLASILLARVMGVAEYGTFAFVTATVLLLTVPSVLGFDRLVVRDVAVYTSRQSFDLVRGLMRQANLVVFVLATCLAAVVAYGAWLLSGAAITTPLVALWVGLLSLPLAALGRVSQASLMGLGRVVSAQSSELLLRPLLFLALAAGVALTFRLDAPTALWLQLLATAVGLLISLRLLARAMPSAARVARPAYRSREWTRSSLELALLSGAAVLSAQTGTFLLGALRSPDEAGLYAVATRGALLISFGLTAVNAALAPVTARMWAAGDVERLQRAVTLSARAIVAFALPVALLFMVFAGTVLEIGFGRDYVAGAPALTILSLGQLANSVLGSVGTLLIMTGHQRQAAAGIAAGAILNVALGALLIPVQGITGAAIAATVSIIAWNILLALFASRRLGVHPTAIGRIGRHKRKGGLAQGPRTAGDGHVPPRDGDANG